MRSLLSPLADRDQEMVVGARVADGLADAAAHGSTAALSFARTCTDDELRLGLSFVTTVLEIASVSARALSAAQTERARPPRAPPCH
jgi:hypothetical protein